MQKSPLLISQSTCVLIIQSTPPPPPPPPRILSSRMGLDVKCGGYSIWSSMHFSPIFRFLSFSHTTHHSVFGTAALILLRERWRILKATITAQNSQFLLQLTLWEARGRGRERRERRKGWEIQIWAEEGHLRPPVILPPHPHPQGKVMCLGWRGRVLHLLRVNLTPTLEVKQVTIQHSPFPHYQQIDRATVPLMQTVC